VPSNLSHFLFMNSRPVIQSAVWGITDDPPYAAFLQLTDAIYTIAQSQLDAVHALTPKTTISQAGFRAVPQPFQIIPVCVVGDQGSAEERDRGNSDQ
jgi:hypothetical protein